MNFEVTELKNLLLSGDGSRHFRMQTDKRHYVDFGILNDEMCVYLWGCPGCGRDFLKALEEYAAENQLKLTIPTVLSKRLMHILETSGYTMKKEPYYGDICELWSKP